MENSFPRSASIISERNWRIFASAVIGLLLCELVSVRILFSWFSQISIGKVTIADKYNSILFAAFFGITGAIGFIDYLIHSRCIRMDEKQLLIGRRKISWDHVETISLNGTNKSWFNYKGDSIILNLRSGKVEYLYDQLFSNGPQLKLFIAENIFGKVKYLNNPETVTSIELSKEQFTVYSDYQLLSFSGLMMWVPISLLLCLSLFVSFDPWYGRLLVLGFSLLLFYGISGSMHRFKVSSRFLIVQNQNLFWVQKVYRLAEIDEAIIEEGGGKRKQLRIVTRNFQTKLYPASSLWDETWLQLRDKLDANGVNMRNDCINTNPIW